MVITVSELQHMLDSMIVNECKATVLYGYKIKKSIKSDYTQICFNTDKV